MMLVIMNGYGEGFKEGDEINQENQIELLKTENGWTIKGIISPEN